MFYGASAFDQDIGGRSSGNMTDVPLCLGLYQDLVRVDACGVGVLRPAPRPSTRTSAGGVTAADAAAGD